MQILGLKIICKNYQSIICQRLVWNYEKLLKICIIYTRALRDGIWKTFDKQEIKITIQLLGLFFWNEKTFQLSRSLNIR